MFSIDCQSGCGMGRPFRLPENDGAVFEGIGFDILVALAGFGNPISSAKGKFRLF
jgi:putative transposase